MPQGTIKEFDPGTRSGTLLQDDHAEIAFDAASLEGSSLRYLRIGQRVRYDLEDRGATSVARRLRHITID